MMRKRKMHPLIMCKRCVLEQSLSVDNLFGFFIIFKYFKVPTLYQRFQAINLLLAVILLFSSFKAYTIVKFADACLPTLKGEVGIIHVHMLIHR
ncbi:unnamed protein product [Vicia faba]|uniref:Uncharacterized protein n=1 Tax=Vicia faba TaxID=3906 RepID=A0AAV0ZB97_VICFA|nr:unnamed protein product [Vicia faba]